MRQDIVLKLFIKLFFLLHVAPGRILMLKIVQFLSTTFIDQSAKCFCMNLTIKTMVFKQNIEQNHSKTLLLSVSVLGYALGTSF